MSESDDHEVKTREEMDISRWGFPRPPGGCLPWICLLLLLSSSLYVLYDIFLTPPRPVQALPQDEWWGMRYVVAAILLGIIFSAGVLNWYYWRWLRLAQRPWQQLQRGNAAVAEQAYKKALAYANSYTDDNQRRGVMLRELGLYLSNAGRHNEAKAMLSVSIGILERFAATMPLDYIAALNNHAVFLNGAKDYETAQRMLERAIDLSLALKKNNIQIPELDFMLRLNLAGLLRTNQLDHAAIQLDEAERLFTMLSRSNRKNFQQFLLREKCFLNCALGRYDVVERELKKVANLEGADLLRAQARIHLARDELEQAEKLLRMDVAQWEKLGTSHRPDALETHIDLAQSLFGQAKHDEAFAVLQEARRIVADFALPPDAAWKKTLETWLQRARELGKAYLAASLDAELQQIPAVVNQAITILEKFRVHPKTEV